MHYYQHNVGDYARDTSHLTIIEHGIYRLLLDWCYLNEKPIPTERAMRVGRGYPTETQSVLSEFFTETPDGWEHGRVLREIEKYHRKAKSNRENGMKGGRPKAKQNPVGFQSEPIRNPNQEPITNNQEKDQKKKQAARSAPPPSKPEGVTDETWDGWLELRRKKRAPVTAKVLSEAQAEAARAGMTLDRFLSVWVYRGSQGLQADWLKPHERAGPQGKPSAAAHFRNTTYTGANHAHNQRPPRQGLADRGFPAYNPRDDLPAIDGEAIRIDD